jgi:hypothetical protein
MREWKDKAGTRRSGQNEGELKRVVTQVCVVGERCGATVILLQRGQLGPCGILNTYSNVI